MESLLARSLSGWGHYDVDIPPGLPKCAAARAPYSCGRVTNASAGAHPVAPAASRFIHARRRRAESLTGIFGKEVGLTAALLHLVPFGDPVGEPPVDLLETCFNNEIIPAFWQSHFSALRSTLESGVPTARNRLGGHRQGAAVVDVPNYLVAYVLHLTASAIVFLAEAGKRLK